jgi:hypothetical protein
MENVIIGFKDNYEVLQAENAVKNVYGGLIKKTKDGLGLILPNKILDWGVVFLNANVPYRGLIVIG